MAVVTMLLVGFLLFGVVYWGCVAFSKWKKGRDSKRDETPTVSEVWVYLDESQAPSATGTERGQPFWVAAFATDKPVPQALIDQALTNLRSDPEANGNPSDEAALQRRYFHASLDSKNAHSWLCRSIVAAQLNASFSASLWYFERKDGRDREGADLHRLSALLSALSVLQDDYDLVHVFAARRA